MAKFKMTLDLSGSEFGGSPKRRRVGISRLLRNTAEKVEAGKVEGTLLDLGGNQVGTWSFDQLEG